jgi:hypothetical protein
LVLDSCSKLPTTLEFQVFAKIQATDQEENQKQQKDHRDGTKTCKIHGNTHMELRSGNGGRMGGGAVLSLSSNAMRRGRQAGRSGNDEERRNSEKRGEWQRERNPDLLIDFGISAWHCDNMSRSRQGHGHGARKGPNYYLKFYLKKRFSMHGVLNIDEIKN